MLERVSLFNSRRDFLLFLLACGFVLCYTLLIEFQNYQNLIRFDSAVVEATVLKQYTKTKNGQTYQVLKLKSKKGFSFYTSQNNSFPHAKNKEVNLEIYTDTISFYAYLTSFYAHAKKIQIYPLTTLKERFNNAIALAHENKEIANIYQALFSATPLERNLQTAFSSLGLSHLLALSGFHLGVLSALVFFLIKYPYKFFQERYFPYRSANRDIFFMTSALLLIYLLFLDSPSSLLRAFGMLVVGFVLYDRGIKIISMQTLFLSVLLLLSFFPRLFFAVGFWLSVSGVFYIFLFLIHFKNLSKFWQFVALPFWVYLMMLPFSLALFANFSLTHPLSILYSVAFTLFYPLSIFLHFIGYGAIFDSLLESLIRLGENPTNVTLDLKWLIFQIILSLAAIKQRSFLALLLLSSFSILVYAVYHIT